METDRPPSALAVCPSCGDTAPFPVRCDRCDRVMRVAGVAPDPLDDATPIERAWRVIGPLVGLASTFSCAASVATRGFGTLPWPWWDVRRACDALVELCVVVHAFAGPLPLVALAFVGLVLGHAVADAKVRESRLARRRARGLDAMAAVARCALDALPAGPVRVVGTVVDLRPVRTAAGLACAATENLPGGGASPAARCPSGGTFALRDATGRRVDVDARHVRVVVGYDFDGESSVPDGALVELVATARHRPDATSSGYRSAAHTAVLEGDARAPVLVRVLAAR